MNRRYPALEILVTKEWVEKYFKSVGYTTVPQELLPYSFYSCLRSNEFELFAEIGIELKQLLHVSQSYSYFAHLKVGDTITSRAGVEKVSSRKLGGENIVFLELRNTYYRRGEIVAESRGSVIVRELRS